jgi:hypothetical protein
LLIEKDDYNTSVTGGTEHQIAHSIPINTTVDLSNIVNEDYFKNESNELTVTIKNNTGTTTHETFTFTPERDNTNFYDDTSKEFLHVPYRNKSDWQYSSGYYARRGYKRYIKVGIAGETDDYEAQSALKVIEVGDQFFRIKSVSAGTFDDTEGIAHSRLTLFNQIDESIQECMYHFDNSDTGIAANRSVFHIEKNGYAFLQSETTQNINVYRFHRNTYRSAIHLPVSEDHIYTNVIFNYEGISDEIETDWPDGLVTKTHNYTKTFSSSGSGWISLSTKNDKTFYFPLPNGYSDRSSGYADVNVLSTSSQTGDGHFKMEATVVNGLAGSTTSVRVYRTGGNSTAVDVVVAVGNSDQTLSFGAGDIYKEFTITHASHDGQTFTAGMTPTNDKFYPSDFKNPLEFIVRKDTYEFGNVDSLDQNFVKKVGGDELWQDKIPFQRTGWTNSSVKFYVTSNNNVLLEAYKIYEISHHPNCDIAGDNTDCPDYNRCYVIPEYHSQQLDVTASLSISNHPPLLYRLNDKCKSTKCYVNNRVEALIDPTGGNEFGIGGHFVVHNNSNAYLYYTDDHIKITETGPYTNTATVTEAYCGGEWTDYLNYFIPTGCYLFDTTVICREINCVGSEYVAGSTTANVYPSTQERTFQPTLGSRYIKKAFCYEINTCDTTDFSTTDAVEKVCVSAEAKKANRVATRNLSQHLDFCPDHLEGDRFLIERQDHNFEYFTIWEWTGFSGFATTDAGQVIISDCDAVFVGQESVYVYDCTDPATPTPIKTPSEIATAVDNLLPAGSADYWFEYVNASNSADDGFYKVTHSGTLSGPFSTASDGSVSFENIFEQVGIAVELNVELWEPVFANYPNGNAFDIGWLGINSVITNGTNSTSIKAEMLYGIGSGGGSLCGASQSGYDFSVGFGAISRIVQGGRSGSLAAAHGTCSAPDPGYTGTCPEDFEVPEGQCWKIFGNPTYVTGSCTSTVPPERRTPMEVCCESLTTSTETVDYSYYDFTSLANYNGTLHAGGLVADKSTSFSFALTYGFVYSSNLFLIEENSNPTFAFVESFIKDNSRNVGVGPASCSYLSFDYYFPVKWGDCWDGMDARTESWSGATDNVIGVSTLYPVQAISYGTPYLQNFINTLGDPATSIFGDCTVNYETVSKSNFSITVQAYSPTWQKF